MTRGQVGLLGLTCTTLSFATSRRLIPAHSIFGPIQGRDKWRVPSYATPEAALRFLYSVPYKQEAAGSSPALPTIFPQCLCVYLKDSPREVFRLATILLPVCYPRQFNTSIGFPSLPANPSRETGQ